MKSSGKIWNRRTFGAVLCFYTVFSLFFVPRIFFAENARDELRMILLFGLANYIWAGLTLIVFQLGEKFPIVYPPNLKNLALHFFFSLTVAAIFTSIYVPAVNFYTFGVLSFTVNKFPAFFIINTVTNSFLYYTGSLAAHQAIFYSQKLREREVQLREAELEMLKAQLHPHFFFNTLHAISALMYRSPKDADRLIVRLGDMFRVALKKDKTQEIPLKEELELLEAFLQIHQTLMGKRLQIEWQIEQAALDALVPNLILQPLAENAIQHGISPIENGGKITISAAREDGQLHLQITDTGLGFETTNGEQKNEKSEIGSGTGLFNVQSRLKNLYGERHLLSIEERKTGGVGVQIKIPFRQAV